MEDWLARAAFIARLRSVTQELVALTGAAESEAVLGAVEERLARLKGSRVSGTAAGAGAREAVLACGPRRSRAEA